MARAPRRSTPSPTRTQGGRRRRTSQYVSRGPTGPLVPVPDLLQLGTVDGVGFQEPLADVFPLRAAFLRIRLERLEKGGEAGRGHDRASLIKGRGRCNPAAYGSRGCATGGRRCLDRPQSHSRNCCPTSLAESAGCGLALVEHQPHGTRPELLREPSSLSSRLRAGCHCGQRIRLSESVHEIGSSQLFVRPITRGARTSRACCCPAGLRARPRSC